jgi:hypothetical protein
MAYLFIEGSRNLLGVVKQLLRRMQSILQCGNCSGISIEIPIQ